MLLKTAFYEPHILRNGRLSDLVKINSSIELLSVEKNGEMDGLLTGERPEKEHIQPLELKLFYRFVISWWKKHNIISSNQSKHEICFQKHRGSHQWFYGYVFFVIWGHVHRWLWVSLADALGCDTHCLFSVKIAKFDTESKEMVFWTEENCWPSEPVFVPRPNGESEDDGKDASRHHHVWWNSVSPLTKLFFFFF